MSSESLTTWQIFVSGKVQGVGYRRFAQNTAMEIGLKGWVRNLKDHRVEVRAQGNAGQLANFLEKLKEGPVSGRVDKAEVHSIAMEKFQDFQIAQDGE